MTYKLYFNKKAEKEWKKLSPVLREQFKKKLANVLDNPHIVSARLRDMPDCYKIKLRQSGYRLVYQVSDHMITVTVIGVGKRDKNHIYEISKLRL